MSRRGPRLNRIESAAVAAVVVTLSLGVWWWTSQPSEALDPPPSAPPTFPGEGAAPAHAAIFVHVAGEVRNPGVVRLPTGSRTVDAIEAAGGATERAVLSGVNLAAEVADGAQVIVPSLESARSPSGTDDGMVALNTATTAELETLPGVGPVLAGRIVAHRDEHGPFQTAEDLLDVSGIGESILARLRPSIRVP